MGIGPGPQPPAVPPGVAIVTDVESDTKISTTQGSVYLMYRNLEENDSNFLISTDGKTWTFALWAPAATSMTTGKNYFILVYQQPLSNKIKFSKTVSKEDLTWSGVGLGEAGEGFTDDYGALPVICFHDDGSENGILYATYKNNAGNLVYTTSDSDGVTWSDEVVLVNMTNVEPKILVSLAVTVPVDTAGNAPVFAAYTAVNTLPTQDQLNGTRSSDKSAVIAYGGRVPVERVIYQFNATNSFCLGQVDITSSNLSNPSNNSIFVTTQFVFQSTDKTKIYHKNNVQQIKFTEFGSGMVQKNETWDTSLNYNPERASSSLPAVFNYQYYNTFPVSIIYENDYVVAGWSPFRSTPSLTVGRPTFQLAFFINSTGSTLFLPRDWDKIPANNEMQPIDLDKNYSRGTSLARLDGTLYFFYISIRKDDNTLSYQSTTTNFYFDETTIVRGGKWGVISSEPYI